MNHEDHEKMEQQVFPRVARCAPVNPDELSLTRAGCDGNESWASVYWMAWYVCEAHIKDGRLTLSEWRPLWADRGRLTFPLEEASAPEGWTPLDPCPDCGCEDVRVGHGSYGATYATCQRCAWQDVLQDGDPDPYDETAHQRAQEVRLEGEAQAMADYWGEDLYGPPGTRR